MSTSNIRIEALASAIGQEPDQAQINSAMAKS